MDWDRLGRKGVALLALGTWGCAGAGAVSEAPTPTGNLESVSLAEVLTDPFPSTYQPFPSEPTVIRGATILTGTGERIENGTLVLQGGKIQAVGTEVAVPATARMVDGAGKFVTPGIIDTHSHLGVYASPGIETQQDGNEITAPNTAQVWAEHSIWPHDPGFASALAGGITSLQILPGSANLFGGRGVTLKNVPSRTYQGMKFPGAPHALKMACGENPKRIYGGMGRSPASAMANVAGYRADWARAQEYRRQWQKWIRDGSDPATRPARDLQLETLAGVLEGQIRIHNHCYRADEMATMIDIAGEFGYSIASFHHAVEAYKVRDLLVEHEICASMWADWWGFKLEAYDGILQNVALVHEDGGCAIVHSDDARGIQRLNQESAKVMRAAAEMGLEVPDEEAIRWITSNPAVAMGIDEVTGTLEPGKNADVVVWSGNPFSVYSKAERVYIDGALLYNRQAEDPLLYGDFMLRQPGGNR
ncbi:MAG: amidohydrolase [Gemmatimonadetes bacterium]|nr:amidohydrolase [Gemmatimonadota bacterium]